jgi:tetratricopeptide (TPR) repeat protein
MGMSEWFRRRATSATSQADLLGALLEGFEREDYDRLMRLINENSDRIRAEFRSWTSVPERIRQDPTALARYAHALNGIAALFDKSGDPSLKRWLEGNDRENPFKHWDELLRRAEMRTNSGHAADAVPLLRDALEQMSAAAVVGIDAFRARVLGRLGVALAKTGNTPEAIRVTREALDICQRLNDQDGVRAYTQNLNAIGTYEVTDATDGGRFTVVFMDAEGRTLAPEELAAAIGRVRWEIRDHKELHPEAKRLHEAGRAAGSTGDHDAAIALFAEAAALDSSWPYPVYDRAFAHLLKRDFDAALTDYRKVLELSPRGFFVASAAVDMLTREAAGEFPPGLYAAFAMLEHMPAEQQRSIAQQLVEKFPAHAPAWQVHAGFLEDASERLAAIEHGLAARPDPDTRGSLLVGQALALHRLGETDRALMILEPLTTSISDSLSTQAKAYLARAFIQSQTR